MGRNTHKREPDEERLILALSASIFQASVSDRFHDTRSIFTCVSTVPGAIAPQPTLPDEECQRLPVDPGEILQFGHVNAPLSRFDLCDEGLRSTQAARRVDLAESGLFAGLSQPLHESPIARGM
jgi:hypothetical protein